MFSTYTNMADHPKGLSNNGPKEASGTLFGFYKKEYVEKADPHEGAWRPFEEYPGYEIRPCSIRVVEVRKAGGTITLRQFNDVNFFENGWYCHLYLEGKRTKIELKPYWTKYSNKTCLGAFKRFISIGRQ